MICLGEKEESIIVIDDSDFETSVNLGDAGKPVNGSSQSSASAHVVPSSIYAAVSSLSSNSFAPISNTTAAKSISPELTTTKPGVTLFIKWRCLS